MKKHFLSIILAISIIAAININVIADDNINTEDIINKDSTVKISFAGDCTLGSFLGSSNSFGKYWNENGTEYFFSNVKPIFESDDITFINLEGPLTSHKQEVEKQFSMRGEPEYVNILTNGSVEAVNFVNNHAKDCGIIGYNDTIDLLLNNNIMYCKDDSIAIIENNGIRTAFIGFNGWTINDDLCNQIKRNIESAKKVANIVCVEFHWGEERNHYSNTVQETLGHFAIDCGADIVVGAHSHCLQGIELYNNKLIVYSLGNFCFGGNSNPADKNTMIFQVEFTKDGIYKNTNIIPCKISSVNNTNDFKPTPASEADAVQIMKDLEKYSKKYEHSIFNIDSKGNTDNDN